MKNDYRALKRDLRKSRFDQPLLIEGPFILGEILRRNIAKQREQLEPQVHHALGLVQFRPRLRITSPCSSK